jgi:hypothetical protein
MDVIRFDNPAKYAAVATPLLMRNEAENCFFLGCIGGQTDLSDWVLCVVRDEAHRPIAAATMTPGKQMVVTRAPDAAVITLADYLHRQQVALPGIGGVRETAEAFARRWVELTGVATRVHVAMAVHQSTRVVAPRPTRGAMRIAEPRDIDLVGQWVTEFHTEIGAVHVDTGRNIAQRRIAAASIFLWEDKGEPVAMAGAAGPTPNGIRVNLVYTPPANRGRGYASNLVAQLSQRLLDGGNKFCFLYTDLANPTSNKIYKQIGYEPLSESVHIMFDGAAGSH